MKPTSLNIQAIANSINNVKFRNINNERTVRDAIPISDNIRVQNRIILDPISNNTTKYTTDIERDEYHVSDNTRVVTKPSLIKTSIDTNTNNKETSNIDDYINPIKPFIATNIQQSDIPECTKFNRLYLETIGNNPEAVGFVGDAWKVGNNILNNGGDVVYDSGYKISDRSSNASDINKTIEASINKNKLNTKLLKAGDVVDIHYPNSKHVTQAFSESNFTTATTHNGIIVEKDNNLYIQHNISGKIYLDPIDKPNYKIARAYRPNYGRPDFNKVLKGRESTSTSQSIVTTIGSALGIKSEGKTTSNATYDLTNKSVDFTRTSEYVPDTKAILFSDFVEGSNIERQTLLASDYINLKKNKPDRDITSASGNDVISKVKDTDIFYGVENGKLKIDSLHNFNPNTIVTPSKFKSEIDSVGFNSDSKKPNLRLFNKGNIRFNNIQDSKGKILVSSKYNKLGEPTDSTKLIAGDPTYIKRELKSFIKYNKNVKAITVDNGRFNHRFQYPNNRNLNKDDYAKQYASDFNRDYYPSVSISLK